MNQGQTGALECASRWDPHPAPSPGPPLRGTLGHPRVGAGPGPPLRVQPERGKSSWQCRDSLPAPPPAPQHRASVSPFEKTAIPVGAEDGAVPHHRSDTHVADGGPSPGFALNLGVWSPRWAVGELGTDEMGYKQVVPHTHVIPPDGFHTLSVKKLKIYSH